MIAYSFYPVVAVALGSYVLVRSSGRRRFTAQLFGASLAGMGLFLGLALIDAQIALDKSSIETHYAALR